MTRRLAGSALGRPAACRAGTVSHAFYRHYYVYRSARSERSVIATVYRLISSMILPVWRFRLAGGAPPPRGPAGGSRVCLTVL